MIVPKRLKQSMLRKHQNKLRGTTKGDVMDREQIWMLQKCGCSKSGCYSWKGRTEQTPVGEETKPARDHGMEKPSGNPDTHLPFSPQTLSIPVEQVALTKTSFFPPFNGQNNHFALLKHVYHKSALNNSFVQSQSDTQPQFEKCGCFQIYPAWILWVSIRLYQLQLGND